MHYSNVLKTIGNTPVIQLKRYSQNKDVTILAKLEGSNPGGSIKDRIALSMMIDAQKSGLLTKNKAIIEATSGNTGIGLAMVAAHLGYKFTAIMPESASVERRKLIEAYGATIILTDGKKGTNYSIEVANNLIKENSEKYIQLDQFNNRMNTQAHYMTTGKEIVNQAPEITQIGRAHV